jgi:hypothetical protein
MGRVILRIFATTVLVVVRDKVFKDCRVEIEFLGEDVLKAELDDLVDEGAAEIVTLGGVGNILTDAVKHWCFRASVRLNREDVVVLNGDITQRIIKQLGEVCIVLVLEQMRDEVIGLQTRSPSGQLQEL